MNKLDQAVKTVAHEDVERMIHQICWRFQQRYGGEYDDWLSEASEAFVRAMDHYDADQSALTTWIYTCVNNALREHVRQVARRREVVNHDAADRLSVDRNRPGIEGWIREVSEDAAIVIQVIASLPVDLLGCRSKNTRQQKLRGKLREKFRWTSLRIAKSFEELEEAVSGA